MPREGHDFDYAGYFNGRREISIHVPREGHDLGTAPIFLQLYISIHVPREGHDNIAALTQRVTAIFQSTCPARGTTTHETVTQAHR